MKLHRPHPVTMWRFVSRFFFLLIVPLVQAILREPFSEVAWRNLPLVLLVLGTAYFQYSCCGYAVYSSEEALLFQLRTHEPLTGKGPLVVWKNGFLLRRELMLPTRNIASAFLRTNPLLSLFGAGKLLLDTPAANAKKPSLTLFLRKQSLLDWWEGLRSPVTHRYRANSIPVVLMAASWSNPASGLLLVSLLLDRAGAILGEELTGELYDSVNQTQRLIALGLPPAVALFGWLLALGWFLAFLVQMFRYAFFTVEQTPCGTLISRGAVVKSRQLLTAQSVRAISVRQTLVMRVLRRFSVYLHTIGSGKEKGDRSLLLAAARQEDMRRHVEQFYPRAASYLWQQQEKISPPKESLVGFVLGPVWQAALIMVWYVLFRIYLPLFAPLVLFFLVFPAYFLVLHVWAWKKSFLAVSGGHITACGYVQGQLYTAVVPLELLQAVVIRQNPFQRKSGRCHVRLCVGTEQGACFDLYHFSLQEVRRLERHMQQ